MNEEYKDFEFRVTGENTCSVENYNGKSTEISIPKEVEIDGKQYQVTEIDESAFDGNDYITKVSFPDGLKKIGSRAFCGCPLTSISIPDSVETIGPGAFYSSELEETLIYCKGTKVYGWTGYERKCTSVTLPDTVIEIGESAFYQCCFMTKANIPNSVKYIRENAFNDCEELLNQDLFIPDSVEKIERGAFLSCYHILQISIPEACEVDSEAFEDDAVVIRRECDSSENNSGEDEENHEIEMKISVGECYFYDAVNVDIADFELDDDDDISDADPESFSELLDCGRATNSGDIYNEIESVEIFVDGEKKYSYSGDEFRKLCQNDLKEEFLNETEFDKYMYVNRKTMDSWWTTDSFDITGKFDIKKIKFWTTQHYLSRDQKDLVYVDCMITYVNNIIDGDLTSGDWDFSEYTDDYQIFELPENNDDYECEDEATTTNGGVITCISSSISANGRDMSKYALNGEGSYNKSELGAAAVAFAVNKLTAEGKSVDEAVEQINGIMKKNKMILASSKEGFFDEKRCKTADANGTTIYVNTQWTVEKFDEFLSGMNALLAKFYEPDTVKIKCNDDENCLKERKCEGTGVLNGHEYVDLGLPSGTKWATCNVGATKPAEYGDYFAWVRPSRRRITAIVPTSGARAVLEARPNTAPTATMAPLTTRRCWMRRTMQPPRTGAVRGGCRQERKLTS